MKKNPDKWVEGFSELSKWGEVQNHSHENEFVLLLTILDPSLISITGLKVSFVHNRIIWAM